MGVFLALDNPLLWRCTVFRFRKFSCIISLIISFLWSSQVTCNFVILFIFLFIFLTFLGDSFTFYLPLRCLFVLCSFYFPTSIFVFASRKHTFSYIFQQHIHVTAKHFFFFFRGIVSVSSGFLFFCLFWFVLVGSFPQLFGSPWAGGLCLRVKHGKAGGSSLRGQGLLTEGLVQWGKDPEIWVSLGLLFSGSWCFLIETVRSVLGGEGASMWSRCCCSAGDWARGPEPTVPCGLVFVMCLRPALCCASRLPVESLCSFSPENMPLRSSGTWQLPYRMNGVGEFGLQFGAFIIYWNELRKVAVYYK